MERLNPRHWTLVWKLVIVGLVPALLALALGVLRIADQAGSAADLGRSGRLLEARNEIVAAATALRGERDQATLFAASNGNGDRAALDSSRSAPTRRSTTMRGGLAAATPDLEPATVAAMQRTQDSLDLIVVAAADGHGHAVSAVRPGRQPLHERHRRDRRAGSRDPAPAAHPGHGGPRRCVERRHQRVEQLSIQHAILSGAIRAGKPLPGDPAVVNAATAQLVNNYRDYQAALTPEQLAKFGNLPDTSATSRMDQLRSAILTAPFQLGPLARDWDTAYDQARESTDRTAGLISAELSATAAAAAQRASNLAGINSVILMLGLLVGITIAVLVARSLIRSLRLLRSSALDVAERRLPQAVESMRAGETPDVAVEPVPIGTRDEVGQVARAFDAVHGQAVRLAAEQAALQANVSAMFINLSRRSQALVERQLQLIEALESNEQDADQLSNLFQLDHLATRMRRNSENLLVLAGTDLAKRNMAPVPVVDVLRAAVSEVEQYQRVVVQAPPAASLAGRAGSDLVHLLAELLDNATAFSPPESQVVMSTTRSPDGAIVIEISDRGVGMADDELADANTRLVGPSGVDVSASRRMGLFVVGRLAARHGIGVRLVQHRGRARLRAHGFGQRAAVAHPHRRARRRAPARRRPDARGRPGAGPSGGGPPDLRPMPTVPVPLRCLRWSRGRTRPATRRRPHARRLPPGARAPCSRASRRSTATPRTGCPARRPGSSLRPDGPPPTEAPPGGFFDDGGRGEGGRGEGGRGEGGRGEDGRGEDGGRPPGEQARLDQEAAARRDRMGGGPGLTAVPPPNQPRDDERSVSDDERSASERRSRRPAAAHQELHRVRRSPGSGPPRTLRRAGTSGRRRRHRRAGDGQVRSPPRRAATRHRQAPHRLAGRGPDRQRSHRRRATRLRPGRRRPRRRGPHRHRRLDSGRADAERADTGRPDPGQSDAGRGDPAAPTPTAATPTAATPAAATPTAATPAAATPTGPTGAGATSAAPTPTAATPSRTDADRTDVSRTDAGRERLRPYRHRSNRHGPR